MLQKVRLYFSAVLQLDLFPLLLFTVAGRVATTDVTSTDASSVLSGQRGRQAKMHAGKEASRQRGKQAEQHRRRQEHVGFFFLRHAYNYSEVQANQLETVQAKFSRTQNSNWPEARQSAISAQNSTTIMNNINEQYMGASSDALATRPDIGKTRI